MDDRPMGKWCFYSLAGRCKKKAVGKSWYCVEHLERQLNLAEIQASARLDAVRKEGA